MSKLMNTSEFARYKPYSIESYNITPYNPLDRDDIKNEQCLTPKEKYVLDAIRSTECELTNKRRRRGLKRGRPKSERKKITPKQDLWLESLEEEIRENWFDHYWAAWFPRPEDYFGQWPWESLKGSLYSSTLLENSRFYIWIICGRKEDRYTCTVGAILRKVGEPFRNTQRGTVVMLITMMGTQLTEVIRIINACKRDKTLRAKVVIALQYAVDCGALEIELDEAIFHKNTRYYIPEVPVILSDVENHHEQQ